MSNFIQTDSQHLQQIAQNQAQQAQETHNTQKVQQVQQKDIDDFNHAMENPNKTNQTSQEMGKNPSLTYQQLDSSAYSVPNGSQVGYGQIQGQGQGQGQGQELVQGQVQEQVQELVQGQVQEQVQRQGQGFAQSGQNQTMSLEQAFSMAQAKVMTQNTTPTQSQATTQSQAQSNTQLQGVTQNAEQLVNATNDVTKVQKIKYNELEDSKTKIQNPFAQASNPLATNMQNSNPINAPIQSITPSAQINEKLVESILVSQAGADTQEVRLTVSKSILPDTEIIMNRDIHGTLNVTLATNNVSSFQTLVAAQHDLNAILAKSESDIKITVQSDKQHGDQNNPNQRSNGLIDFDNEQA